MTPKPLSLKQRTSSIDANRDATAKKWLSVIGMLKLREFLITVDHFSIWKRHLAWAIADGKELRDYMTQRYSSSMVFMSLLLSTELSVLFNSAVVTTEVRHALEEERYDTVPFWVGIVIIVSAILTLLGLVSTFTAWGMVSAVNEVNAHCVFRSSIGQYVADLPGHFIVGSIYTFSIWLVLFFFLLLPVGFSSFLLLGITSGLFVHTITVFSAFGRIIMHSGAMGPNRIFDPVFESTLSPCALHGNLLARARQALYDGFSIRRQYAESDPLNYDLTILDGLKRQICTPKDDQPEFASKYYPDIESGYSPNRKRTGSLVKLDDGFDTNGQFFASEVSQPGTKPTNSDSRQHSFFTASPGEYVNDWMVYRPSHDRREIRNKQGLSSRIRNDRIVGARDSEFFELWQTMSESASCDAKDDSIQGASEVQVECLSKLQRETLTQSRDEPFSNEDQDLEYLFDSPQDSLPTTTLDSTYRYLPSVEKVHPRSNEGSPNPTIGLPNLAHMQNRPKHAGNEGTRIGVVHAIAGKSHELDQVMQDEPPTNERSSLLAFPKDVNYSSPPCN